MPLPHAIAMTYYCCAKHHILFCCRETTKEKSYAILDDFQSTHRCTPTSLIFSHYALMN
jgi:hypothetical protein